MSKLEDGVDVHKLTQVNKICAKTCTPNCYALIFPGPNLPRRESGKLGPGARLAEGQICLEPTENRDCHGHKSNHDHHDHIILFH